MSQVDLVHGQRYTVHTPEGIREDTFLGYQWQALRNPDGTLFATGYLAAVWEGLGPLRITGGPEWRTARVPKAWEAPLLCLVGGFALGLLWRVGRG